MLEIKLPPEEAVNIVETLKSTKFITNGAITCTNSPNFCSELTISTIMQNCIEICKITTANYQKSVAEFQNALINLLTNSIWNEEILSKSTKNRFKKK